MRHKIDKLMKLIKYLSTFYGHYSFGFSIYVLKNFSQSMFLLENIDIQYLRKKYHKKMSKF